MEHWAVDRLVGLLNEEKALYQELASVSRRKKKLILSGEIGDLAPLVKTEEEMVDRLTAFEKERVSLSETLADQLGMPPEKFTLKLLAENMREPERRDAILRLRENLFTMVSVQARNNDIVKELLRQKKEYADAMLSLLQTQSFGTTYDSRGSADAAYSAAGLFDLHA